MDYSLHILIIGCTLALVWWVRQEQRSFAQSLTGILNAVRDLLAALVRESKERKE